MKAITLITRAMKAAGVISSEETPQSSDTSDALTVLNAMLDSWSVSRLYIYQLLEENFPLTIGQTTYTMGPGGNFNTTRPNDIQSLYVRYNGIDYPIKQIDNDAYSDIALKNTIAGIPQFMYYDPQNPTGELNFWPAPFANMSVYIQTPSQMTQFHDLVTDVAFPAGYQEAITYSLALRIAAEWGLPPNPSLMQLAEHAVARLQTNNSAAPVLKPDFTTGNGRFNIYRG